MYAVLKGLQSLPESVSVCRIDAQVESMVVFHPWSGHGPRFRKLTLILQLKPFPMDAMLSPKSWKIVQRRFGGINGHDLDLMSLDSNVQPDWRGNPFKHFTLLQGHRVSMFLTKTSLFVMVTALTPTFLRTSFAFSRISECSCYRGSTIVAPPFPGGGSY